MARRIDPGKREAIFKSARKLFSELGVEKTSVAQIAAGAGVATGTVYLYFGSKGKIIDALCDYYLLDHIQTIRAAFEHPDVTQAIPRGVHAALKHASENADLVRLIDMRRSIGGKTNRPEADRVVQRTLRQILAKHIADGTVIPYNPVILAELVSGMVEWISKICFVWSDVDPIRYESTLVELLSHALLKNYTEGSK